LAEGVKGMSSQNQELTRLWEKACTAIPQNHRAPRGFFFLSPTHKLGSPEDMQTFASGEAKVRHPFGNFKP
jgi:hypothetical protein